MTPTSSIESSPGSRTVHSMCRICTAACGIVVHVEGDQIVRVTGDPDHLLSRGYICSKGRALPAMHHSPERLDQPELRGRTAGWDATMADLATSMRLLVDRYGPDAVAAYRSFGWANDCNARYLIDSFLRTLGTHQVYSSITLDLPNKHLVPYLMVGANPLLPLPDWDRTRLALFVGVNPVVSHGHAASTSNPVTRLRSIRARGGVIVVVDPRQTETARLADVHLAPRPGTDTALLACLVRAVLAARPDREYLRAAVDPASLERLTAAVEPYDLDATAARCDLDRSGLERVVELVLGTPRLSLQTGTGLSMGPAANVTEWMAWALGCVTGSLDRPGGSLFNPGFLRPMEAGLVGRPRVTGPAPVTHPELSHTFGEMPSSVMADEILDGPVKALLVVGGNPVRVFPDSAKIERALRSLDVLAVFDVRRTATTALATHLLPVAGQLERADLPAFIDSILPEVFSQYLPQVVAPGAERRSCWRVLAELTRRMGLTGPDPDATDDDLLRKAASHSRVGFDELRASPSGIVAEDAPGPGWLVPGALPNGRIDVAPASLVDQLVAWERDVAVGDLVLVNRRLPHQMNSMLQEVPGQQRAPLASILMHPDDSAERGLTPDTEVVVRSLHGVTSARLEVTTAIRRGVVSMPHAFDNPDVNRLTSDHLGLDPLTGMPVLTGVAVEVTAVQLTAIRGA